MRRFFLMLSLFALASLVAAPAAFATSLEVQAVCAEGSPGEASVTVTPRNTVDNEGFQEGETTVTSGDVTRDFPTTAEGSPSTVNIPVTNNEVTVNPPPDLDIPGNARGVPGTFQVEGGPCGELPPEPTTPEPTTPEPTTPEEPTTPAPETPAPETPAPETPAPETPAPETPEGPSQEANQSNEQSGTATGGGDVVNNASNVAQQCQTGGQVVDGNGNTLIDQQQCSQIVNSVQAGGDAEQVVSNVVDQDQNATGVQYGSETPAETQAPAETPAPEAAPAPAETPAPAEEVAPVVKESVVEAGGSQAQADAAASAAASAVAESGDAESADAESVASAAASAAAEAGAGEDVADVAYSAAEDTAAEAVQGESISELPDTGGAPLFMLLGGTLLVGGALLVRRIL